MKKHNDKGRFIVACAILESNKCSPQLKDVALKCALAYSNNIKKDEQS